MVERQKNPIYRGQCQATPENDCIIDQGIVRVFDKVRDDGQWILRGDPIRGDGLTRRFGNSALSDDGNVMAAGGRPLSGSNSYRVYDYVIGNWRERNNTALKGVDGIYGKPFLSGDGNTLVTEWARIFDWNGEQWLEREGLPGYNIALG